MMLFLTCKFVIVDDLICRKDLHIKSVHGTMAVFLQNDAGFMKWEPTPERIKELVLAYRPSDSTKSNSQLVWNYDKSSLYVYINFWKMSWSICGDFLEIERTVTVCKFLHTIMIASYLGFLELKVGFWTVACWHWKASLALLSEFSGILILNA